MPRLKEVPRADVGSPRVLETYERHFGDRDPVADPGTVSGTPGNWWTVFALDTDLFHLMLDRQTWQFSETRELDALLRELALARTGWFAGSIFVYSQHCKLARRHGATEEQISAIPSWSTQPCYSEVERLVLAYADDLVAGGGRVPDARFHGLKEHLSEVAILELTYMICTYVMSSIMAKALRLEYDDVPDPVVEVRPT